MFWMEKPEIVFKIVIDEENKKIIVDTLEDEDDS